jgi:hypothetical protein
MAQPSDRESFKEYCLRKLGAPVIEINVADEQVDDRIDEAISFFRDYHYDGSQLVYLKHQLTETELEQGWIAVPSRLLGITRIFDLGTSISTGSGMFNVSYQFVLNNLEQITGYDVTNYYMTMQHLEFLQEILVGKPLIRYNRHVDKLFIDIRKNTLKAGSFIIMEAYDIVDGDVYADFWRDRWLQNYAATLIKEQWGFNLTKFEGMQLVGGVTFNGTQILSDAREERLRLEDQAMNSLQPLIHNFCG